MSQHDATVYLGQWLEFGKFFASGIASDFFPLAYTSGLNQFGTTFRRTLNFPDKTSFKSQVGHVSLALILFERTPDTVRYLLVQVHRRREDEFGDPDTAPTNRPYNQERYTLITSDDIKKNMQVGYEFFPSLIYKNSDTHDENARFWLKTYNNHDILISNDDAKVPLSLPSIDTSDQGWRLPYLWRYLQGQLSVDDKILTQIKSIANALIQHEYVQVCENWSIEHKVMVVSAIQRLVFPKIGIITFAFDQITSQKVNLQFSSTITDSNNAHSYVIDFKDGLLNESASNSYSDLLLGFLKETSDKLIPYNKSFQEIWIQICQILFSHTFSRVLQSGGNVVNADDIYWLTNHTNRTHGQSERIARFKRSHQFLDGETKQRILRELGQSDLLELLEDARLQNDILKALQAPLPDFADVLQKSANVLPAQIVLGQLKVSLLTSPPTILHQCNDWTLEKLLDLYEIEPVKFQDNRDLLDVWTGLNDQKLDRFLVFRMKVGRLIEPILYAIVHANREDLLSFFIKYSDDLKSSLADYHQFIVQKSNPISLQQVDDEMLSDLMHLREKSRLRFGDGTDLLATIVRLETKRFDRLLREFLETGRLVKEILSVLEDCSRANLLDFYLAVPRPDENLFFQMLERLTEDSQRDHLINNGSKLRQFLEPQLRRSQTLPVVNSSIRNKLCSIFKDVAIHSPRFSEWFLKHNLLDLVDEQMDYSTLFHRKHSPNYFSSIFLLYSSILILCSSISLFSESTSSNNSGFSS